MEKEKIFVDKPTCRQKYLYFLQLLEDVMLTGIPQIIQQKNIRRKTFKILVFVLCVFGFCYQLFTFLVLYFTYPTTLEVLVQFADTDDMPRPVVTVCDLNGLRRSAYCKDFQYRCEKPTDIKAFCSKYHHFCEKENLTEDDLMFPSAEHYWLSDYERSLIIKYGIREEDIFNGRRNISTQIIYTNELMKLRRCHSIDMHHLDLPYLNSPYDALNLYDIGGNTIGNIALKFKPEEYFRPNIPIGAKISIHAKDQLVNPFIDGFLVKPGHRYIVQLRVIEEDLLASPYSTNCTYYEEWADVSLENIYTHDRCIVECRKAHILQHCKCAPPFYPYYLDAEEFCESFEKLRCASLLDIDDCFTHCKRSCRSRSFEYEIDEIPLEVTNFITDAKPPDLNGEDETHHFRERVVALNFFYKRPEVLIYKYKPQYQMIEMFGYLGGYIGIWLGISLIAVFDFLEMLTAYIYHVIKGKVPINRKWCDDESLEIKTCV